MNKKTCYVIVAESGRYYRYWTNIPLFIYDISKAALYDYEEEAEDMAQRINSRMDDGTLVDDRIGAHVEVVPVKVTVEVDLDSQQPTEY